MANVKMLVYTNALSGKDDEFNRWYDTIHIPEVIQLTKAVAAQRFRVSKAQPDGPGPYRYLAIYEFEVDSKEAYESLTASTEKRKFRRIHQPVVLSRSDYSVDAPGTGPVSLPFPVGTPVAPSHCGRGGSAIAQLTEEHRPPRGEGQS